MSAIYGCLAFHGASPPPEHLARMEASMAPWGPEGQRFFVEGPLAMGHALGAITPHEGTQAQPFRSPDRRWLALFDGRLDDRDELAAALALPPEASTWEDGRLWLHAWSTWGEAALDRLRGAFACALWDEQERHLTLVRDGCGEASLHFAIEGDRLYFASALRGLMGLGTLGSTLNEGEILRSLLLEQHDHGATLYEGIERLPPGSWLRVSETGDRRSRRYHDPFLRSLALGSLQLNPEERVEAMEAQLLRAVRRRLRTDHPVASQLSGGLDSGCVTAMAARIQAEKGRGLSAFTAVPAPGGRMAVPPGRDPDEGPTASRFCQTLPAVDWHAVPFAHEPFLADEEAFRLFSSEALRMPFCHRWYDDLSAAARHRGCRVLLGAFAGNFTVTHDPAVADLQTFFNTSRLAGRGLVRATLSTLRSWLRQQLRPGDYGDRLRGDAWQAFSLAAPAALAATGALEEARAARSFAPPPEAPSPVPPGLEDNDFRCRATLGFSWWRDYWFHGLGRHGLILWDPFTDRDLLEFSLRLPEADFHVGHRHRGLGRALARRWLPDVYVNPPCRGNQISNWPERIHRGLPAMSSSLKALEGNEQASRLLDLPRARRYLEAWPTVDFTSREFFTRYFFGLGRALAYGRFILHHRAPTPTI